MVVFILKCRSTTKPYFLIQPSGKLGRISSSSSFFDDDVSAKSNLNKVTRIVRRYHFEPQPDSLLSSYMQRIIPLTAYTKTYQDHRRVFTAFAQHIGTSSHFICIEHTFWMIRIKLSIYLFLFCCVFIQYNLYQLDQFKTKDYLSFNIGSKPKKSESQLGRTSSEGPVNNWDR